MLMAATVFLAQCRGRVEPSKGKPGRIVSMVPSATETLFAIGAGGSVVGVCDQCRWPEEASALPGAGSYLNPSVETILGLEPDLVILYGTQGQLAASLGESGIPVLKILTENLEDLPASILLVGKAVGRVEEAGVLVERIRGDLEALKAKAGKAGTKRPKTVVVVDRIPSGLQRLFVAAGNGYVSSLVEMAGGENCFRSMTAGYPMVSLEAIAACRPDIVIDIRPEDELAGDRKERALAMWKEAGLLAPGETPVRVELIGPSPVTIPGPRVAESVGILQAIIEGK